MQKNRVIIGVVAVTALLAGGFAVVSAVSTASAEAVTAELKSADGDRVGKVTFTRSENETDLIDVVLRLDHAPTTDTALDSFHGFHVHANDDPANGSGCVADPQAASSTWFTAVDGHLTDSGKNHGEHIGDMPSVLINSDQSASLRFATTRFNLDQLVDKAVVLHAGPDNFDNVPVGAAADQYTPNSAGATDKTQKTGNAGDRIACGIIAR